MFVFPFYGRKCWKNHMLTVQFSTLIYSRVNILRYVSFVFESPPPIPHSWMLYSYFHVKQLYAFPSTITKPWQPISALSNSSLTVPNISITMQIGPLSSAVGHLFSSEMLWFSVSEWARFKTFGQECPCCLWPNNHFPPSISINEQPFFVCVCVCNF